jgi:signal transduction histidine kinase
MRRAHALPVLLALIAALLVCAASWQAQERFRADARTELAQKLQSVLHTSHQAVRSRLAQHLVTMQTWTSGPALRETSLRLVEAAARDAGSLRDLADQQSLSALFARIERDTSYRRLAVIVPGNIVAAASDPRSVGMRIPEGAQAGFLQSLWSGKSALSLPEPGKERLERDHWLFAGIPIEDGGSVRALLALSIPLATDFSELLEQGRFAATGETYAFDAKARLLSNSRFDEELRELGLIATGDSPILRLQVRDPGRQDVIATPEADRSALPLTRMAEAAIVERRAGLDLDGYRDYRGVDVVGAWLWDAEIGIGMATEQDRKEAYAAIDRTLRAIRVATALMLVLLGLAVYSHALYRQNRNSRLALENYKGHLEELVEARTAELRRSTAELESYSYSIAHDLRQPLRGITSFSQILREEAAARLDEDQRELLDRIAAAGLRMSELIDAILEVGRITRHPMQPVDIDLGALAEGIAAELAAQGTGRASTVRVQPGLRACADATLVETALRELLENALIFSASRGNEAHVEVGRTEGGEFFVRDNGPGIDMRFADRLFKPFNRLHDDAALGGPGIGLAIAGRVIERHGGRIHADSMDGAGTTIYFTLPAPR